MKWNELNWTIQSNTKIKWTTVTGGEQINIDAFPDNVLPLTVLYLKKKNSLHFYG